MGMSAFQVVVSHKLDSLWKMLLNEDQRIFETKQATDNYNIHLAMASMSTNT